MNEHAIRLAVLVSARAGMAPEGIAEQFEMPEGEVKRILAEWELPPAPPQPAAAPDGSAPKAPEDPRRDRAVSEVRWRHEAMSDIAAKEALNAMSLPDTPTDRTLEDRLRDNTQPVPFHIEELVRENHNVVVGALYKTGKTSLAVARARAEVDGVPFLGCFDTRRLDGNVGFWNNEIEPADCDDYFRQHGITNRRRILIEDLKGYRVPLLHDAGAEWAVEWLREREIESWYLDPWRSVCSWSKVNEYRDPEVAPLVDGIDAIKREAGVRYVHINHHCGARDMLRPRGATALPDWADSVWAYSRESGHRYLSAIGRAVGLDEGCVRLDGGNRLEFEEGSRGDHAKTEAREQLVAYVEEHPGCKTGDATAAIDAKNNNVRTGAVKSAVERKEIVEVPKGTSKLLYPAGQAPQENPDV